MLELGSYPTVLRPRWNWWDKVPWRAERNVEPVELCARRFGYQPSLFRWRGALHRVARIERVWEQAAQRRQAARRYFTVRCNDAQCYTLFQDLQIGTWHLVQAPALTLR